MNKEFAIMARKWLYGNDLPEEWEDAVTEEFDAAISDRMAEILTTDKEGRPFAMPVVDWEARIPYEEAAEAALDHGHPHE